jgi:hypothetical protein
MCVSCQKTPRRDEAKKRRGFLLGKKDSKQGGYTPLAHQQHFARTPSRTLQHPSAHYNISY